MGVFAFLFKERDAMKNTPAKPARKAVAKKTAACRAAPKKTAYGKRVAELLLAIPADVEIRVK